MPWSENWEAFGTLLSIGKDQPCLVLGYIIYLTSGRFVHINMYDTTLFDQCRFTKRRREGSITWLQLRDLSAPASTCECTQCTPWQVSFLRASQYIGSHFPDRNSQSQFKIGPSIKWFQLKVFGTMIAAQWAVPTHFCVEDFVCAEEKSQCRC